MKSDSLLQRKNISFSRCYPSAEDFKGMTAWIGVQRCPTTTMSNDANMVGPDDDEDIDVKL